MQELDPLPISVVVSYSSMEAPFIGPLVREAARFSDDVTVVAYGRLFDGTPQDLSLLPDLPVRTLTLAWSADKTARYWHNHARWAGAQAARHEWVLFLDGDEVPEGERMREFLAGFRPARDAYSFGCHWYFREPIYRATRDFECAVLLPKRLITPELVYSPEERWEFRKHPGIRAQEHVLGTDKKPLFHHYSWVRSKEAMLKKVATWAHKDERDWTALVEEEFSRPFNGTDFVFNFQYTTVPDRFGIKL